MTTIRTVDRRHIPSFVWLLGIPLLGALVWLGLLLGLGTTAPLEATVGRSMDPTLRTGDLAVVRGIAPAELRVGDVVAIRVSEADQQEYGYPESVMHRVIDIRMADGRLMVQTQGDNQGQPDPFLTSIHDVDRTLVARVPLAGWLLFFLQSTQGKIAVLGLLALFLLYEAVSWATYTAEEILEPDPEEGQPLAGGFRELTYAVNEYGEHLRSHTKVVQELGGTTEELHSATAMQREVLSGLQEAVRALAAQTRGGVLAPPVAPRAPAVPPAPPAWEPPAAPTSATAEADAGPEFVYEPAAEPSSVHPEPVEGRTGSSPSPPALRGLADPIPTDELAPDPDLPASAVPRLRAPPAAPEERGRVPALLAWTQEALTLRVPPTLDGERLFALGMQLELLPAAESVAFERFADAALFTIETRYPAYVIGALAQFPELALVLEPRPGREGQPA